jgi:hypothetical protein
VPRDRLTRGDGRRGLDHGDVKALTAPPAACGRLIPELYSRAILIFPASRVPPDPPYQRFAWRHELFPGPPRLPIFAQPNQFRQRLRHEDLERPAGVVRIFDKVQLSLGLLRLVSQEAF